MITYGVYMYIPGVSWFIASLLRLSVHHAFIMINNSCSRSAFYVFVVGVAFELCRSCDKCLDRPCSCDITVPVAILAMIIGAVVLSLQLSIQAIAHVLRIISRLVLGAS